MPINLQDVQKANQVVDKFIKKTETEFSQSCSKLVGTNIFLKFENLQMTGSFKIRGATNKIYHLSPEEKKCGVVASSAGNHAQGVALAAARQGVNAKIVMPVKAPLVKTMATRGYGAEVVLHGNFYDEAYERALEIEKNEKRVFVHPYDDPLVIAGQGTIALEILKTVPDIDSVVVPIGGGGLISGIATVMKELRPQCRIFGVQSEGAKSMEESFRQKKLVQLNQFTSTIADGIAVKKVSANMLNHYILKLVDDVVTVSEDEIAESIVFLMERAKTIVEGSGAVGLAAAQKLQGRLGKKCCVILSGGNIDSNIVAKVIERGLKKKGRLTHIQVAVEDAPGMLSQLTKAIAEQHANIIQVIHDRTTDGLYLGETAIEFILETSNFEQIELLKKSFSKIGRVL